MLVRLRLRREIWQKVPRLVPRDLCCLFDNRLVLFFDSFLVSCFIYHCYRHCHCQFNHQSTRGHCIMTLEVEMPHPDMPGMKQKGRVYVCDLAGTEPAGDIVYALYEKKVGVVGFGHWRVVAYRANG